MKAELIAFKRGEFRGENPEDAEPPEQIGYLSRWFDDLTDWRESGWGIGPLSHQEIESWARLFQINLRPFEVDMLRRIDREFRAYQREKENPAPAEESRPMTRELFDSLFK